MDIWEFIEETLPGVDPYQFYWQNKEQVQEAYSEWQQSPGKI